MHIKYKMLNLWTIDLLNIIPFFVKNNPQKCSNSFPNLTLQRHPSLLLPIGSYHRRCIDCWMLRVYVLQLWSIIFLKIFHQSSRCLLTYHHPQFHRTNTKDLSNEGLAYQFNGCVDVEICFIVKSLAAPPPQSTKSNWCTHDASNILNFLIET